MTTSPDRSDAPASDHRHPPFVDKLVSDPKQPPRTLLLSGYTGASSEEGHTRLYFDPQLADYVEIPDAAILHRQAMPAEQSPLGGSYLWVQRDAELIHGPVGGNRQKARFLEGRLQSDMAGTGAAIAQPTAPIVCADPTEVPRCHPTTPAMGCPHPTTPVAGCPHPTTVGVNCPHPTVPGVNCPAPTTPGVNCPVPTSPVACPPPHPTTPAAGCPAPSAHCPTHNLHCVPTEVSPHCPTNVIPCQTHPVQCGSTSAKFPCFAGPQADLGPAAASALPACAVSLGSPLCATHLPLCQPPTLTGPACGVSHVSPCPPVTHIPHLCPTHLPQLCPTHAPLLCPTHVLPHCPPVTLTGPCGFTHSPVQCSPTLLPAQCPTHSPVLCGPVTGTAGCAVTLAGCPTGVACVPQTIPGQPGYGAMPGLYGGYPG